MNKSWILANSAIDMDNLEDIPRIDKPFFYMFNGEVIRIGQCIKQVQNAQVFTGYGELYGLFTHSGGPVVHVATLRGLNHRQLQDVLSSRVEQTPNDYGLSLLGEWFTRQNMKISIRDILLKKADTLSESERYFCIILEESQTNFDTEDFSDRIHAFFLMKGQFCKMNKKILNRESPFRLDVDFVDKISLVRTKVTEDVCLIRRECVGIELNDLSGTGKLTTNLPCSDSRKLSDPNTNALPGLQNENGNESEGRNTSEQEGGEDHSLRESEKNLQKESEIEDAFGAAQLTEGNSELTSESTKSEDRESVEIKESLPDEENVATEDGIDKLNEVQKEISCVPGTNSISKFTTEDVDDVDRVAQKSDRAESDEIENTVSGQNTSEQEGGEDHSLRGSEKNIQKESEIEDAFDAVQLTEGNSELTSESIKSEDRKSVEIRESLAGEENVATASSPVVKAVEAVTDGGIDNLNEEQKEICCVPGANSTSGNTTEDVDDVDRVAQKSDKAESDEIKNTKSSKLENVTAQDDLSVNEAFIKSFTTIMESDTVENQRKPAAVDDEQHETSSECNQNFARDSTMENDKSKIKRELPTGEQSLATEEVSVDAIKYKKKANIPDRGQGNTMLSAGTNSIEKSKIENGDSYACIAKQSEENCGKSESETEERWVVVEEPPHLRTSATAVLSEIHEKPSNNEALNYAEHELDRIAEKYEEEKDDKTDDIESDDFEKLPPDKRLSTMHTSCETGSTFNKGETIENQYRLVVVGNEEHKTSFAPEENSPRDDEDGDNICQKSQVTEKDERGKDGSDDPENKPDEKSSTDRETFNNSSSTDKSQGELNVVDNERDKTNLEYQGDRVGEDIGQISQVTPKDENDVDEPEKMPDEEYEEGSSSVTEEDERGKDESEDSENTLDEESSTDSETFNNSSSTDESQGELNYVDNERDKTNCEDKGDGVGEDIGQKSQVTLKDENDADESEKMPDEEYEEGSSSESKTSSDSSSSSTSESPTELDEDDDDKE